MNKKVWQKANGWVNAEILDELKHKKKVSKTKIHLALKMTGDVKGSKKQFCR